MGEWHAVSARTYPLGLAGRTVMRWVTACGWKVAHWPDCFLWKSRSQLFPVSLQGPHLNLRFHLLGEHLQECFADTCDSAPSFCVPFLLRMESFTWGTMLGTWALSSTLNLYVTHPIKCHVLCFHYTYLYIRIT